MNYTLEELLESIALFAHRVETNFLRRIPDENVHDEAQEPERLKVSSEHQSEKPKPAHVASKNDVRQAVGQSHCQEKKKRNRRKKKASDRQTENIPQSAQNAPKKNRRGRRGNKTRGSNEDKSQPLQHQKQKKRKEYLNAVRSWDVKHKTSIVRFHPEDDPQPIDLQGSRKRCVFCQTSFHSDRVLQHHLIRSHGDRFDLSPLLEIDNRNLILRNVVDVELEQLPRAGISFRLKITNLTSVTLLLKSVYVFDGNESLIPIFAEGGVLRMASDYFHEDEIHLEGLHLTADCVYSLLVTVNPIDGERLPYDIVVQYHFKESSKKNHRIIGTPLRLANLPRYVIPEAIKNLYQNNFRKRGSYELLERQILSRVEEAKKPSSLTIDNYTKQLSLLNQIEAEHLRCEFEGYTIEQPKFIKVKKVKNRQDGTKYEQLLYALSIDQFPNRPSLIEEDIFVGISVELRQTVECYKGIVECVEPTMIMMLLDRDIPKAAKTLSIEFHFNKATFQLEQQALRLLSECRKEDILFPFGGQREPLEEEITSFQWIRTSIASNEEQMMAVRNIVNRTSFPAPYVLFGPPGTGKSSTLVEAIGQIYRLRTTANILVVAPSNFAANEITTRLLLDMPEKSVYRFFSRKCLRKVDDINGGILEVSNMIDKEFDLPCYEDIYLARVVVATLATAGRLVQANIADKNFSYVIIDECGSAKEISALVPIGELATCGEEIHASIVLAGDPKQLGPVIRYDFLKQTTHCTSLLERIMKLDLYSMNPTTKEYDTRVITQLRDSFRSHSKLLQFSNNRFYDGQLRAKAPPEITDWALGWHRLPNPKCPLIFRSVTGQIQTDNNSFSLYNVEEGEVVLDYVKDILTNGINGRTVKQTEIGIISPYARQVLHLRDLCKAQKWAGIEIGSAEQYQGREKEIIIISTVRSQCNHVGFLADVKRLNVTITRAKALMIVVGDEKTLRFNGHWKKFIAYCRKNKAYIEASQTATLDGAELKEPKKSRRSKKEKSGKKTTDKKTVDQKTADKKKTENSEKSKKPKKSKKSAKSNKPKKSKKSEKSNKSKKSKNSEKSEQSKNPVRSGQTG